MNDLMKRPDVLAAIQIMADNPKITSKEVANAIGVNVKTIYNWRNNPNFVEAVYNRFMVKLDLELPAVIDATIREAKAGNVQAARLILEHAGKLVKNINVTIDSPFEKFLKASGEEVEYEDAEIEEVVQIMPEPESDLPERKVENQIQRTKNENKRIKKVILSEKQKLNRNKKRREWYKWVKRAKAVGVDPLPSKRPTPAQKEAWINEIKKKENE